MNIHQLYIIENFISNNIIITFAIVITFTVFSFLYRFKNKNKRHKRNIKAAKKYLNTLKKINHPAKQFTYIRKIDPFVFEEMILTSLHSLNYKIIRNKRYTGDGGIDGQVIINGKKILIQVKRYSHHINKSHIEEFNLVCLQRGCKGLFIHSGKTGIGSRKEAMKYELDIVSGERLLKLLLRESFAPRLMIKS